MSPRSPAPSTSAPSTSGRAPRSEPAAPTSSRPRSAAVDAVRVLGIIAIVAGHTWDQSQGLRSVLSLWQVPAFFLLAGYLWSGRRPVREDVRHRAQTLLRPYFTWLAVIGGPLAVWVWVDRGDAPVGLVGGLLFGAQLGRPFSAFWFVAALFLVGVFVRVCQALPTAVPWVLALGGTAAAYAWGASMADTPYSVGMVLPCALFVLVGQQLRAHRRRIRRPLAAGLTLLAVCAVLVAARTIGPVDLKYGVLGTPVLGVVAAVTASIALVLVAEAVVPRLPGTVQTPITVLAGAGLVVLLVHAAVLYATDSIAGLPLVLCFVLALGLPWGFGLIVLRTRLAPWMLGREPLSTGLSTGRRTEVSRP